MHNTAPPHFFDNLPGFLRDQTVVVDVNMKTNMFVIETADRAGILCTTEDPTCRRKSGCETLQPPQPPTERIRTKRRLGCPADQDLSSELVHMYLISLCVLSVDCLQLNVSKPYPSCTLFTEPPAMVMLKTVHAYLQTQLVGPINLIYKMFGKGNFRFLENGKKKQNCSRKQNT